ncbi:hypothetical protein O0L34_g3450 [Tuta absoluta]|nr:hypothetical protein O0L34_g3450 [Tuta absoluta]
MGSASILLSVVAVFLVIYAVDSAAASSRCPPPNQIYDYTKKESCHSDSQCSGGKVCCVTPARNKACVQPAFGAQNYNKYDQAKNTATGTYCGGKKCGAFEKCGQDSRGKPICKR